MVHPDGLTCVPDGAGARCTHGPLAAATSTASYLLVAVAPGAPAGAPPSIAISGQQYPLHPVITAFG